MEACLVVGGECLSHGSGSESDSIKVIPNQLMRPDSTTVTVLIVNWNGKEELTACLRSIVEHVGDLSVQVIVVDNASSDGSAGHVRKLFPTVELIESGGNLGFGRACNLGARRATGEFILFLNPDARLTPGALNLMVQCMKSQPDIGALGCKIIDDDGVVVELGEQRFPTPLGEFFKLMFVSSRSFRRYGNHLRRHDPKVSGDVVKLYGACLLVRRLVFNEIGGFDERFFMYAEDGDLCRRISATKRRLFYLASAEILHASGALSEKAGGGFATLMMCESIWKFVVKYHGFCGGVGYKVAILLGASLRLFACLILYAVSWLFRREQSPFWRARSRRYEAMLCWSISLKKAFVPK